jgi:hypothetical protein
MSSSRTSFRAWVRAAHPDVGGDPEAFAEGLRRREQAREQAHRAPAVTVIVRRRRGPLGVVDRWLERRRRRGRALE